MRFAQVAVLSLAVLAVGSTVAQDIKSQDLKSIEVRAEKSDRALTLACVNPELPTLKDVEQVLGISDPAQSKALRDKLMAAAAEACAQKQPKILVTRSASGGLTWKPLS